MIVVTVDANECTIAKVGNKFELIWHKESYVSRKQDAGGQSQRRYEKNRELELIHWIKDIADKINHLERYQLILAGPAQTKEKLVKYLDKSIDILNIVDVGYTTEQGIWEAIEKSQDAINDCELVEEKKLGDRFAMMLAKNSDLVDYGPNFNKDNVEMILVSQKINSIPGFNVKVIRHPVIEALGICIFKKYGHVVQRLT